MTISSEEQLLLADTVNTSGFELVVRILEAHTEELEVELESSKSDADEQRLLREWRSYRKIVGTIKELQQLVQVEPVLDSLDPFDNRRQEYLRGLVEGFGNMGTGEREYATE